MKAEQQLLEIYREFPCRTLPNAFWKTAVFLDKARLDVRWDTNNRLEYLAIWLEDRLLALWCDRPKENDTFKNLEAHDSFALVHADCLPLFPQRKFSGQRAYFRLVHSGTQQDVDWPYGFGCDTVNPETDVTAIVKIIQACYQNMKVDVETVREWLSHPVYDSNLWVWAVDFTTGVRTGLGIAEFDSKVPEASLEWIQVHPDYQNMGLGKAIVAELLHRINHRAMFSTVSGECDHPNSPESLYRKCGFYGSDVWWLFAK